MPLIPGSENIPWSYAGMDFAALVSWILIATGIGRLARALLKGPALLGLWGDMGIALVGGFLVGAGLRFVSVDLTAIVLKIAPALDLRFAILIDVALAALIGALLIRLLLRLFGGKG